MSKILFSPIGNTDPIKYMYDGSMLHICRVYRPDVVYLYLSHEMMQFHKKDNRYIKTIQWLGEKLNHSFDVKIIERDDLIDVQQYDRFYFDFREIIHNIEREMSREDILYINMASGTPAMKSALLVMATLAEYRFMPIQVSTPKNAGNLELEERRDYEVEGNWECDEDNAEDFTNRCTEVKCVNLMRLLKIETIKKHILVHDYCAALNVAQEIEADIPEEAFLLLKAADARLKLDYNQVVRLLRGTDFDIYPIREDNKRSIFEYALGLDIKLKKEEYADFIRGITPLVADLLELILEKDCGIKIDNLCKQDGDVRKWDRQKLQAAGYLPFLNQAYGGEFRAGVIYSDHLAKFIQEYSRNERLIEAVRSIVEVEQKVRNPAAHEIVSVTNQWIRNRTKRTAEEIMETIRKLTQWAGICGRTEWNSYEKMNESILQRLRL